MIVDFIFEQDPVSKVRHLFVTKLHKGLIRHFPHRNLPLDFMGFYVFGGLEDDVTIKQTIKQVMLVDITRRRDYIKSLTRHDTNGIIFFIRNYYLLNIRFLNALKNIYILINLCNIRCSM